MVRPRITTLTGLTRQLLSSSTAAGREIKLSPLPSSSSPSPLLSVQAPPRSSYRLPLTGTDSRKNRPTLSVRDVLAQVALKRREEAVKNRRPVPPVSLPGKVLPAAEHPIELPPRRSTRPGILKKSDQPQKARARHVSFGETSVKIVDRWIKSDDPAPIKPTPRPLAGPSILKKSGNPRKASARHVSFGEKSVQVVSRWIKPEDRDPVSEPSPISTLPPSPRSRSRSPPHFSAPSPLRPRLRSGLRSPRLPSSSCQRASSTDSTPSA
ncbi:hypothetical protein N7492_008065 [Penicillium capsulatum]|uniref:Uncharacterized protein n=1 Tax=Penicillium capsulatum TaxID=69766 RepID=A0A9W9LGQ4_9EURO|nr:hypothetical protein N7492_008065 [Penicillium capsulatum]